MDNTDLLVLIVSAGFTFNILLAAAIFYFFYRKFRSIEARIALRVSPVRRRMTTTSAEFPAMSKVPPRASRKRGRDDSAAAPA